MINCNNDDFTMRCRPRYIGKSAYEAADAYAPHKSFQDVAELSLLKYL